MGYFPYSPQHPERLLVRVRWNARIRADPIHPTVDVRDMLPERYVETLFLNETAAIHGLYQFDAPSSPEKWERIWSEVEAA